MTELGVTFGGATTKTCAPAAVTSTPPRSAASRGTRPVPESSTSVQLVGPARAVPTCARPPLPLRARCRRASRPQRRRSLRVRPGPTGARSRSARAVVTAAVLRLRLPPRVVPGSGAGSALGGAVRGNRKEGSIGHLPWCEEQCDGVERKIQLDLRGAGRAHRKCPALLDLSLRLSDFRDRRICRKRGVLCYSRGIGTVVLVFAVDSSCPSAKRQHRPGISGLLRGGRCGL